MAASPPTLCLLATLWLTLSIFNVQAAKEVYASVVHKYAVRLRDLAILDNAKQRALSSKGDAKLQAQVKAAVQAVKWFAGLRIKDQNETNYKNVQAKMKPLAVKFKPLAEYQPMIDVGERLVKLFEKEGKQVWVTKGPVFSLMHHLTTLSLFQLQAPTLSRETENEVNIAINKWCSLIQEIEQRVISDAPTITPREVKTDAQKIRKNLEAILTGKKGNGACSPCRCLTMTFVAALVSGRILWLIWPKIFNNSTMLASSTKDLFPKLYSTDSSQEELTSSSSTVLILATVGLIIAAAILLSLLYYYFCKRIGPNKKTARAATTKKKSNKSGPGLAVGKSSQPIVTSPATEIQDFNLAALKSKAKEKSVGKGPNMADVYSQNDLPQ